MSGVFRLDIASAFHGVRQGLRPAKHHERYGYDLSWIVIRRDRLVCDGCGDRVGLSAEKSLVLVGVMCGAFVERHARCGRAAAARMVA